MRWLERCLVESSPRLQHFVEITASLAKLETGGRNEGCMPGVGVEPTRPAKGHLLLRQARLTRSATPARRV